MSMNNVDLTVIVDESNDLGKYYLTYLSSAGLKPVEIVILKRKFNLRNYLKTIAKKVLERFGYNERLGLSSCNLEQIKDAERVINSRFDILVDQEFLYNKFSDVVTELKVGEAVINDSILYEYLSSSTSRVLLFSGGGIVNKQLLSLPNKTFIHTHPGIVPDVKGADCLFWSILVKGKPGYSCFYMSPEIDEGDIIHQEEFAIEDHLYNDLKGFSNDILYKAMLNSLDLHYRAKCLLNALSKAEGINQSLDKLPTIKQNSDEGRMYFFMHRDLVNYVLEKHIKCH